MSDNGWSWPVSWCASARPLLVGPGPADVWLARVRRLRRQCSLSTPKPTSRRKGFWSAGARFTRASLTLQGHLHEGVWVGAGGSRTKLRRRGLPQPQSWRTSMSPRRRKTRRRWSQTRHHLTEMNAGKRPCSGVRSQKIPSSISTSARPLSRPRVEKHHPQSASRHPNTHGTPATKIADSPLH